MDERQLADLILAAAEAHAARRGFRLGEGAEHFFRGASETAARDILSGDRDDAAVADGKAQSAANFAALIDAMIDARAEAYAGDAERLAGNVIGEATLGRALAKLCPLWPFCT